MKRRQSFASDLTATKNGSIFFAIYDGIGCQSILTLVISSVYIRSAKKRQRHSVDDIEPEGSIFESASDLTKTALEITLTLFFFYFVIHLIHYIELYKALGDGAK